MFKRSLQVLPSDASYNGSIKLKSILDYFQDTAGIAVENIYGTSTDLASKGYAWILRDYEINFLRTVPSLDEKFSIYTGHDPNHGFNCLRIFRLANELDNIVIYSKTSWLLIDLTSQKPVKPLVHLPEINSENTLEIDPDFEKIPKLENADYEFEHKINFHDLDINTHVNNAAYFQWIFDIAVRILDDMNLIENLSYIRASFRNSIKFDDEIKILVSKSENKMLFNIVNTSKSSKPSAEFLTNFKKFL